MAAVLGLPQAPAAAGPKSEIMGGVFGVDPWNPDTSITAFSGKGSIVSTGTKGGMPKVVVDTSGGSGPYKANWTTHPSLPGHTIFVPKVPPPANVKMPVIAWGNGGCMATGSAYSNFLSEIASYGYIVIANGAPGAAPPASKPGTEGTASGLFSALSSTFSFTGGQFLTKPTDLPDAINWIVKNAATLPYGTIDTSLIATAGHSCGGLEAYSASYKDPRVKQVAIFGVGVVMSSKYPLFADLTAPVAYFLGGPTDLGEHFGSIDYGLLPKDLPALKASLDVGHMGTYFEMGGGKIGKAAVALFNWRFKGDAASKALLLDPKSPFITEDGWNITYRNFS